MPFEGSTYQTLPGTIPNGCFQTRGPHPLENTQTTNEVLVYSVPLIERDGPERPEKLDSSSQGAAHKRI